MGVCAGRRGLGVASACAPRAPCQCLDRGRCSPARSPPRSLLLQFALSRASRLYARSLSLSLPPPNLAHKQDGGCCFLPLPNPPYRIAVAAAAGNEPRWGGRVRQRGAEPGLRGGAGAGPRSSSSHNGGSGAEGGADSNHGIRPRAQRGKRFRKLPRRHSVAPFKGEVLKEGGGRKGGLRTYFQSVDIYGRRCLGWVSAQKAVGAQALLRERAKGRSERPSFALAG